MERKSQGKKMVPEVEAKTHVNCLEEALCGGVVRGQVWGRSWGDMEGSR